jgi:hypothetical protein
MAAVGECMCGCRRLEELVMVRWWQGPKLARILIFHDVIHGHACCLRLLLSFPLQLHLDRRGALVCVMLGIDPMEPTEKLLTAASLRWILLLRLRPSAILVSALVPAAASVLVLVRGCRYVVDLTVCLLRWMILPPLRLVPLPLLLLLLRCIGSVKPSAAAFVGFAVFLHDFKELLQRLRLDSIEHILAVSKP